MARRPTPDGPSGAIVIDKPIGPTSFGVMRQVERRLGAMRAGHAGTLDPLASGVLLVLLGEGTKLSNLLMEHDKVYEATIALGQATDTLDAAGTIIAEVPVPVLEPAHVAAVLGRFVGAYDQIPPAYSAIKKDGRSLMSRARAGESDIPLEPRAVVCHALRRIDGGVGDGADPTSLSVEIHCGKGFYVRSLARDIALALGTVGHIRVLRRTRLGAFSVDHAVAPDAATREHILPLASMVPGLATRRLDADDVAHVRAGRRVSLPDAPEQLMALDADGLPVAWLRQDPEQPERYRVERGFVPPKPSGSA